MYPETLSSLDEPVNPKFSVRARQKPRLKLSSLHSEAGGKCTHARMHAQTHIHIIQKNREFARAQLSKVMCVDAGTQVLEEGTLVRCWVKATARVGPGSRGRSEENQGGKRLALCIPRKTRKPYCCVCSACKLLADGRTLALLLPLQPTSTGLPHTCQHTHGPCAWHRRAQHPSTGNGEAEFSAATFSTRGEAGPHRAN